MTQPLAPLIETGFARLEDGDYANARRCALEALRLAPSDAAAHNLAGMAEAAEQNHGEAAYHFKQAVDCAPKDPGYRVNYALALVAEGRFEEARAELNHALELDPDHAKALQNFVWITPVRADDPIIGRMKALKKKLAPGAPDYVAISYAIGKCLDDVGAYDRAFVHFQDANESRPSVYDPSRHERFFAEVKAQWTALFHASAAAEGAPSEKPVFIVGMPRSGSTLLEDKLCAAGDIVGLGEIPDIIAISNAMTRAHPRNAHYPKWCLDAPARGFGDLGRFYLEKHEARHPNAARIVNKSLLNFAYAGLIAAMFPNGFVIDSRRDAVDTCLSCYFTDLKPVHHYALRLSSLAHFYRLYDDLMAHWAGFIDRLAVVKHEEFVADVDGTVGALRRRMGLADAIEEPGRDAERRRYLTFSAWQARQPVVAKTTRRWRSYEKHIGPLLDGLADLRN